MDARREQLAVIDALLAQAAAIDALPAGKRRRRRRNSAVWPTIETISRTGPLRERFPLLLPPRPYCTDDHNTQGLRIRSRALALRCRYIQLNGPSLATWLLFDIDRKDACFAAEEGNLPPPNFIAVTRKGEHKGRAHMATCWLAWCASPWKPTRPATFSQFSAAISAASALTASIPA
jgi:hypothetical protein